MNRRLLVPVFLLIAGGAALAWWQPWSGGGDGGPLRLYGNVDLREVQLGFRVGGRLSTVQVDEGDRVTPGMRVATLDDTPYRQALAAAEAGVAQARARLAALQAGSRPEEIAAARAAVADARAAAEDAERERVREEGLLKDDATSRRLVDAAEARAASTKARLDAAQQRLALAVAGPRREDIDAAQAALAAAEAQRDEAATRVDDARLQAPANGIVSSRIREPGALLGPGEPVLLVTLDDTTYVRAYVAEPDLGRVAPGAAVTLHTDSRAAPYHGRIGFVSPRAEFTPKTVETAELRTDLVYRIRILVDDPDQALRQGMPVTVELTGD